MQALFPAILGVSLLIISHQGYSLLNEIQKESWFFFQLHLRILSHPKSGVDYYCEQPSTTKICKTSLDWHSKNSGDWISPCQQTPKHRRYPPRYFLLRLQCNTANSYWGLKPLSLHFFR